MIYIGGLGEATSDSSVGRAGDCRHSCLRSNLSKSLVRFRFRRIPVGPLAQLVERETVNLKVDGSNPPGTACFGRERLLDFPGRFVAK